MTATVESLAELIAQRVGRDWTYDPSPAPGVLDFHVDGLSFRIVVLDETETIEGIMVYRSTDVTDEEAEAFINSMTATEAAQVARAQELAAQYEEPEQTPLGQEPTREELEDIFRPEEDA